MPKSYKVVFFLSCSENDAFSVVKMLELEFVFLMHSSYPYIILSKSFSCHLEGVLYILIFQTETSCFFGKILSSSFSGNLRCTT